MSAIGNYYNLQKGLFYSKLSEIIKSAKWEISGDLKNSWISWEVVFKDGSILNSFEYIELEIKNDEIKKKKYGYEYTRKSGYFFFYELESFKEDSKLVEKLKKPQFHLHIGVKQEKSSHVQELPELIEHNGPHYKVSSITIDEIIVIIIVNFFEENIDLLNKLKIELS